ncbi:MAG TPA: iron-sulfur cluster assembly scaffold protein, partial [Pirellulales bacterium]|nr:iron-sulfur cluster assembly scaffold protein [Pirellulales bacterium]
MSLDRILEHCEQPYHRGPAPRATHAHEQTNPACGDVVHIELTIEDNIIHHAYFTGVGCRI